MAALATTTKASRARTLLINHQQRVVLKNQKTPSLTEMDTKHFRSDHTHTTPRPLPHTTQTQGLSFENTACEVFLLGTWIERLNHNRRRPQGLAAPPRRHLLLLCFCMPHFGLERNCAHAFYHTSTGGLDLLHAHRRQGSDEQYGQRTIMARRTYTRERVEGEEGRGHAIKGMMQ